MRVASLGQMVDGRLMAFRHAMLKEHKSEVSGGHSTLERFRGKDGSDLRPYAHQSLGPRPAPLAAVLRAGLRALVCLRC